MCLHWDVSARWPVATMAGFCPVHRPWPPFWIAVYLTFPNDVPQVILAFEVCDAVSVLSAKPAPIFDISLWASTSQDVFLVPFMICPRVYVIRLWHFILFVTNDDLPWLQRILSSFFNCMQRIILRIPRIILRSMI
jgi:hypothetical protein